MLKEEAINTEKNNKFGKNNKFSNEQSLLKCMYSISNNEKYFEISSHYSQKWQDKENS